MSHGVCCACIMVGAWGICFDHRLVQDTHGDGGPCERARPFRGVGLVVQPSAGASFDGHRVLFPSLFFIMPMLTRWLLLFLGLRFVRPGRSSSVRSRTSPL